MEPKYQPQQLEQDHYKHWEKEGYFSPKGSGDGYCILIPPPNVTGTLHMGHAFQHTIMDALTRYERMKGKKSLWQPGTDHAGIATQMVVERLLNQEGKTRHDLGRDGFLKRVWQWKEESGNTISQQMRRLGDSPDWSRERFTMDEGLSETVRDVFISLYDEGLIYRGKRLVNWDPVLQTAVSDLEVISEEAQGSLWHMKYPIEGEDRYLIVATTRPETMLGDTAVAVNPNDERYTDLIGKHVTLPLTDRKIPIIADNYVDVDFGTGCVKITPAHDFNDYQIGKRHDLPLINIFTPDATCNDECPEKYRSLDRFDARKAVLADLEKEDLLEKIDDHTLMIPRGDRTNAIIEPYLTDQWFVKTEPLAEPARDAVTSGAIKFVPENWSKTYFQWMDNIEDWCISRQLWWGHRIPAFYDNDGAIYVGKDEDDVRTKYNLEKDVELNQDSDVLDTWFSSALWPFSTLGWPDNEEDLETYLPTNVLVTGFDIIFFWVARMIMMTLKFTDKVPFKEVYITGLIKDENGQKMSKSKGNVIDPIDIIDGITLDTLIEKRTKGMMQPQLAQKITKQTKKQFPEGISSYGTDALRFTFMALASNNRDINFDMNRVEGYRNFCNKLWNAARYIKNTTTDYTAQEHIAIKNRSTADQWIFHKFEVMINDVETYFSQYRFDLASQSIYDFTWNTFCDWYIELTKPIFWDKNGDEQLKTGTYQTLLTILEKLCLVLHPVMPFITEEIWQIFQKETLFTSKSESIMIAKWPERDQNLINHSIDNALSHIIATIRETRHVRKEINVQPGKKIELLLFTDDNDEFTSLNLGKDIIKALAKVETLTLENTSQSIEQAASSLIGKTQLFIPLKGLINLDEERNRLEKKLNTIINELERANNKLSNEGFLAKAPEPVVTKIKVQAKDLEDEKSILVEQLAQLN